MHHIQSLFTIDQYIIPFSSLSNPNLKGWICSCNFAGRPTELRGSLTRVWRTPDARAAAVSCWPVKVVWVNKYDVKSSSQRGEEQRALCMRRALYLWEGLRTKTTQAENARSLALLSKNDPSNLHGLWKPAGVISLICIYNARKGLWS